MSSQPDVWAFVARLGLAIFLGAIVGLERESANKPAGLRTLSLVSLGSCLFALLSIALIDDWQTVPNLRLDPIRVVAGLMGGIGFLGAGAIIQSRGSVGGITTAATIWVTGAIGLACGAGSFLLALAGAVGTLVVLRGLGLLERRFITHHSRDRQREQPRDQGRS